MTHATHHMDAASLHACAHLNDKPLRARIEDLLSDGVPRTAKEIRAVLGSDIIGTRSRLSDGCAADDSEFTKAGLDPWFRKAVRVEEDDSRCPVWAFSLAEVPAVVGAE